MKTSLRSLILILYLVPCCQGDCVAECLTCNKLFYQHQHFNILVCILQCEGQVISSPVIWEECRKIASASSVLPLGVSTSQTRSLSLGSAGNNGGVNSGNTHGFLQTTKIMLPNGSTEGIYNDGAKATFEVDNSQQGTEMPSDQSSYGFHAEPLASNRYGGVMEKKHNFKEVVEGNKSFQKRYGGFMGVRKSVRNWSNLSRQTNQKRYSKFLRQYLGLTARSTEYDSLPDNLAV
ncbi:prepronociceptin b [Carcharodon carcharias]|uniref:prepronociceptin b n=1 Tax=Carcharodon carcharias TaxID=13397 RepID=UPI001B7EF832|nr:prepronociceptin b [Carcharodon carcharias]